MTARKSPRKWTNERLDTEITHVKRIGEVVDSKTPVEVEGECGHRWFARPSLLASGYGCSTCSRGERWTNERFDRDITHVKRFVESHADRLRTLLSTRTTQTNEVGRCAIFLPALGLLADEVGPLGLLDVGASGGLNLLLDRYKYRYETRDGVVTTVGGPSTVVIDAATTGPVPVPREMPVIASRCGIDQRPIDVTDDDEAHWLEACVWPDQPARFHRLVAAIGIARETPPELLAGDAVTSLAPAVERVGPSAHPVLTNSWVLNYLTPESRVAYLTELDRIGAQRDLSWLYAEAPALIPELPNGPDPKDPHRTVLSMARWRGGRRTVEHLATCHPHGFWIHWR
jgi:hypothetical protein